ncbi:phosphoribosylamine--glycine ligase [Microthyrium microscopicum]|uniref:Glycinamide ribonucleotide synthetase n=1 Tax=Microthyrium microscopicum TaxID=703497 RepID=A0A6A6U3W6_9PEZI|nr:phosphoribosylamine--glycine ligase [Microthyrium microscopicum]
MAPNQVVVSTDLSKHFKHLSTGKVRELYEVDDSTILFVATDRVSAFDVVLSNGIPDKGALLTRLTAHWFSVLSKAIPDLKTHLLTLDLPAKLAASEDAAAAQDRSMQVRKLKVFPIESIVRGYITGSAWSEYKKTGTVHGMKMPEGLQESEKLEQPIWTPSTKAEVGEKDENISPEQAAGIVGKDYADAIAALSLKLYKTARDYAAERGIIIADTKFEFGLDEATSPPSVVLIDEVLTPDSSRFWDTEKYQVGKSQSSLDKQYLRDWLIDNGLKGKDGVSMPADVVDRTRQGYVEAYERLTGQKWGGLRVLLVGNGGREHALAWKLSQSPTVSQLFVCPGNGGTSSLAKTTNLSTVSASNFEDLATFAKSNNIDLLIPGPEQPLVDGIVDFFAKHAPKVKSFGPSAKAAHMEGSKTFSKDFMKKYNIPTARYENFDDYEAARKYLDSIDHNVVVKASGLAAGKGVIIPANKEEAHKAIKEVMLDKAFGDAGNEVVIEEFLEGDEISILSFCDGNSFKSLPPAQDHKRIFEGDKGPNTGGMGTYAPAPTKIVTQKIMEQIDDTVLRPTIEGMKKDGYPFIGCLFTGYMITKDGPRLLEYNVRFGDPETQSLMALLDSDLAEILMASAEGRLHQVDVKVSKKCAATVVVAAGGYPDSYKKGTHMSIEAVPSDVVLFHAGTVLNDGELKTSGGRVIASTATAETLEKAIAKAYVGVKSINFEGMQFRKDIGARAL